MLTKFFTKLKKRWVVILVLLVAIPAAAFGAEYAYDTFRAYKNQVSTITKFGRTITLDGTKGDGYDHLVPTKTEEGFLSFINSRIGQLISGSCSSDCTGKACGALNGCGEKCINQTCGAGYTCSALGVCTATNTCGTKNCGLDAAGNVCGTCAGGSYCNNGYCEPCSCIGGNCGYNQCGQPCGSCTSPMECLFNGSGYFCTACTPNCDGLTCGSDGCGGFCACKEGMACDGKNCFACTPKCDGKKCGDDGCGGTCGSCDTKAGETCIDFSCQKCIPKSCDGSFCGDDGCGGSCSCGEGKICGADSKCYDCDPAANCEGKAPCAPDGCGGTCGGKICDKGFVCNIFTDCQPCTCDGKECGDDGCGNLCGECPDPEGQICAPLTGEEYLNSMCVDCPNEGLKCGYSECGRYYGPCGTGENCVDGECKAI